jgi:UDP-2,3-diacylglucosamine pyrophosphatase LpxH
MIIFIGDIHGDFQGLAAQLLYREIQNAKLIQVGDFGVGFKPVDYERTELEVLNRVLTERNNMLYVLRGNHDDPSYFTNNFALSNISLVSDYTILHLDGKKILCVGGAVSVDRTSRTDGKNYWPEERFTFDEAKLSHALDNLKSLDTIVTHNAPSEFWPQGFDRLVLRYAKRDPTLLDDLNTERAY